MSEHFRYGIDNKFAPLWLPFGVRPSKDGVTLTDEYYLAHTALGLGKEELARVILHACENAFLPEYERVALVARMQSELEKVE